VELFQQSQRRGLPGADRRTHRRTAPGHPVALFERACSLDSTGRSDLAVPLYRQALDIGLSGLRRHRAVVQLASSLRNIGRAQESVALLTAERNVDPATLDEPTQALADAVMATLALALADTGREREAVSVALTALAPQLISAAVAGLTAGPSSRWQRSSCAGCQNGSAGWSGLVAAIAARAFPRFCLTLAVVAGQ
jgi:Tetratrico peptide repeat